MATMRGHASPPTATLDLSNPGTLWLSVSPDIVIGVLNEPIAVWGQTSGVLAASRSSATGWTTAQSIQLAPLVGPPRIAIDVQGNALALWAQMGRIMSSRFVPGSGWSSPLQVSAVGAQGGLHPRIVFDGSGAALAVWQEGDGFRTNIWASRYQVGIGWGLAQLVETNDDGSAQYPELAMDVDGRGLAIWRHTEQSGRNTIWVNRFEPASGWGQPEVIESGPGIADQPKIVFLAPGRLVGVGAGHQHRQARVSAAQQLQHFQAVYAWHGDVEQDQIEPFCHDAHVWCICQHLLESFAHDPVVVTNQQADALSHAVPVQSAGGMPSLNHQSGGALRGLFAFHPTTMKTRTFKPALPVISFALLSLSEAALVALCIFGWASVIATTGASV